MQPEKRAKRVTSAPRFGMQFFLCMNRFGPKDTGKRRANPAEKKIREKAFHSLRSGVFYGQSIEDSVREDP